MPLNTIIKDPMASEPNVLQMKINWNPGWGQGASKPVESYHCSCHLQAGAALNLRSSCSLIPDQPFRPRLAQSEPRTSSSPGRLFSLFCGSTFRGQGTGRGGELAHKETLLRKQPQRKSQKPRLPRPNICHSWISHRLTVGMNLWPWTQPGVRGASHSLWLFQENCRVLQTQHDLFLESLSLFLSLSFLLLPLFPHTTQKDLKESINKLIFIEPWLCSRYHVAVLIDLPDNPTKKYITPVGGKE